MSDRANLRFGEILAKSVRQNRTRSRLSYESANGFASDLQRYLVGEEVLRRVSPTRHDSLASASG